MRILIAAAVLIALAAVGLIAVPYAVAWERYRPDIEAAFERMTGHEVTIKGPIGVTFLPRPGLTARDVAMSGQTKGEIGFELQSQQVDVGFQTGPFLVGRPIVDQLKFSRPTLVIGQEASDELLSWPPKLDAWSGVFFPSDLRLMTIDDGRLHVDNGDTSETAAVSELTLTLARARAQGPVEAAGLFKTRDHQFTIATELGKASKDGSSAIKMEIGAQNGVDETTTLKLVGVLQQQGPEAGLRGRIDLVGPDLRRGLKAISLLTDSPSSFLSLAANQPFRMETRFQSTRNMIATEKAKITLNGKFGSGQIALKFNPKPNMDLVLDLPIIHLADDTTLIDFVPLDLLSIFPTRPGKVDINLREMVYRNKSIRRTAIKIVTDNGGIPRVERAKALFPGLVDVHFEGRLSRSENGDTLSGELISSGDDLGETIRWLGLPLPDQGKGWRGFNLGSNVNISNVAVEFSAIDMRLDTTKVEGRAELRFSERMILGLDVDVERLNLDFYTEEESSIIELSGFIGEQFKQLDLSIDARFQRLSWKGMRFEESALLAMVEQQHFKLGSLALRTVGDTEMIVEGEIDLETEAVDLTTELESQFPARMLRHLDIDLPLASARLMPLTLSGWVTGRLGGFDVGVRADYDSGQWLVEGQAGWIQDRAHYDLTIKAEHPDHQALAGHFGLAPLVPADDAPGPFKIDGQLRHHQNGEWITAGSVKLGPTSITGRLKHEETPPENGTWEARVSIGSPKKDSIAPFLALIGHRSTGNWTPRSILGRLPTTGLRMAWLDEIDGSLSLAARGGLAGDGVNLSARLENGLLNVDKLEAGLWDGDLAADFSLERRREQPVASMKIELEDVDAEALTHWLDIPKTIDGPLKFKLEAASVGRTVFDLVRGLSGSLEIEVETGQLRGAGVPALRRTLRDRQGADFAAPASPEDPLTMSLSDFEVTGTLKRGIATLDKGSFAFDPSLGFSAKATAEGTLDLLLWIAEFTLDITTDDGSMAPLALRIIGSPSRPQGLFSAP